MKTPNLRLAAAVLTLESLFVSAPANAQPCTYSIYVPSDAYTVFSSLRDESYVRLDTQPGCPWTAETSASFVTLTPTSGVTILGTGRVGFRVAANFTPRARSATIRIADQFITITQGRGVATVDFNGDGRFDLLWHNPTDGRLSTWVLDGTRYVFSDFFGFVRVADTNWELVGSADLNGDGHADLVWQNNADGRVAAWLMNRLELVRGDVLSLGPVTDSDWRIRAVADLNGDGRADLFWQHRTQGRVAVWYMNGFTVLGASIIQAPVLMDLNWRLVGTSGGSFGEALRFLWQHDGDGRLAWWEVSGERLVSGWLISLGRNGQLESPPPTTWKIRAVGDLNLDGLSDFIWHNQTTGQVSVWFAGPLWHSNRPDLPTSADLSWRLVGPR
jgi:hypothetical protein